MFYGTIFFALAWNLERTPEQTREDHAPSRKYKYTRTNGFERLLHHTWTWKLKALINSGRCMSFIIIIIVIGKTAAVAEATVAAVTAEISSKSAVVVVVVKLLQWRELINLQWCVHCVLYTSRSLLSTPLSRIINSGIANFIRISIKFWMACVRVCASLCLSACLCECVYFYCTMRMLNQTTKRIYCSEN